MNSIPYKLDEASSHLIPTDPGVYLITNLLNGHQYVGSAINLRIRHHAHAYGLNRGKAQRTNRHLFNAWNKYGPDAFIYEILEVLSEIRQLDIEAFKIALYAREQHYIDLLNPIYNILRRAGSSLGVKYSEESCKKMSASRKGVPLSKGHPARLGRPASAESRRKMSETRTGMRVSERARAKISVANRGRKRSPEACARNGDAHRGRVASAEERRKMSESRKGKPRKSPSEETRHKLSESHMGKKLSPEHTAKMSVSLMGKTPWNKGGTLSEETKIQMSKTHTGSTWSPLRRARFEAKKKAQSNQSPSLWDSEDIT